MINLNFLKEYKSESLLQVATRENEMCKMKMMMMV